MAIKLTPQQQQRADKLARMTPREWDAICKRCGICCLIKVKEYVIDDVTGAVNSEGTLYLRRCCDKFDTKTCKCSVYKNRLKLHSNCRKVDMDVVLSDELLPASCGYVEYIFGPAPIPARVDFNQVQPISEKEVDSMSCEQLDHDAIYESIFWNRRHR